MTTTQLLILLGIIWIAPHAPKDYALFAGSISLLVAIYKGSGWV